MQVKFRQRTKLGCGSFALANIFDDHRFLLKLPSVYGERLYDLQMKMAIYHPDLFINTIFITNKHFPVANRLLPENVDIFSMDNITDTEDTPLPPNGVMCYLMSILNPNDDIHMIAVIHDLKTNRVYMVDGARAEVLLISFENLIENFQVIAVSMFSIVDHPNLNNLALMDREHFSHIFDLEE